VTTLLAILAAALVAIVVIGYVLTVINFVERVASLWRRYILRQASAEPATKEDVAEIKQTVDELRSQLSTYLDGLPQATPEVRGPFEEGRRLQHAERHEAAIAQFEKAFTAAKNDRQRCALHLLIGNSLLDLGRLPDGQARYAEALRLGRAAADRQGQAAALGNLGIVYHWRDDVARAEEHHQAALAIYERLDDRPGQAAQLVNLGSVYLHRSDPNGAEVMYRRALAIYEELGRTADQAELLGYLGLLHRKRGRLAQAEEHHRKALAMHRRIGNWPGQANQLRNLGLVYFERNELDKAEEHHRKALAIDEEIGNRSGQAQDLGNLGLVYERRGELDEAEALHKKALALHGEIDDRFGQADILVNLGLLAGRRGDAPQALRYLREARRIFAEAAVSPKVEKVDGLIDMVAKGPPAP
jgi:tetratricopeptide (TPR) repeat protein